MLLAMRSADFDYDLPAELIAQTPSPERDASRLLVLNRRDRRIEHQPSFRSLLKFLNPGDTLVLNNSRVIPARLRGRRLAANSGTTKRIQADTPESSAAQFEILLLEEAAPDQWWAMLRPGKRAKVGTQIHVVGPDGVLAQVVDINEEGHRLLRFSGVADMLRVLEEHGEVPLPPYIRREARVKSETDRQRYQTVYAHTAGSVAAPTAGLHFTQELLSDLRDAGINLVTVTLHVGLGTFAPVKTETLAGHRMHEERFELNAAAARVIEQTRSAGKRVIAVGTTSLRVLESIAAAHAGRIVPSQGRTRLFVYPPWKFAITDALVTNFHLPRSTLLMLVSAFASPGKTDGVELIRSAYAEAIRLHYRFFSYGDAMLLI